MTSGPALSPTRLNTGSPGSAFVREKVRRVIPNRRGMRRKSLLIM
jgi:hypothetical protein